MLKVTDLATHKTLDSKDLRGIKGGSRPGPAFSFLEEIDYDYKEVVNMQQVATLQENKMIQSADVVSVVGGKGNFVGIKGGTNSAWQGNESFNLNG